MRASVFGSVPLLVAMCFGLDPTWGMLTVPFIGFITGFGWAAFGVLIAAVLKSIDHFSYVTSIVITPAFLVAGTYFPLDELPEWAQVLGQFNPLYHCVQLVRGAAFGWQGLWIDLYHVGALLLFGLLAWRAAIGRTEKRLITVAGRARRPAQRARRAGSRAARGCGRGTGRRRRRRGCGGRR